VVENDAVSKDFRKQVLGCGLTIAEATTITPICQSVQFLRQQAIIRCVRELA